MKIIQSYAQFDEGSPYMIGNNPLLNFYTFLLSYLTLKKYYGSVTMFCNEKAYNSFIKYIPYDNINIVENKNSFDFWNVYKLDSMRSIGEDVIHVDCDVFLFNDLFSEFINNDKYDIMVQDILPQEKNFIKDFYKENGIFLKNIGLEKYDGKCLSCGVFGIKINAQEKYFKYVDNIQYYIKNNKLKNVISQTMIVEELIAYLTAINFDYKIYDILPYDMILKDGIEKTAINMKYSHMWFTSKFNEKNIILIKNKIKKDFPNQYNLVMKFDKKIYNI